MTATQTNTGAPATMESYIANMPLGSEQFAGAVMKRVERWTQNITQSGIKRQWIENYRYYLNADPEGAGWSESSFSIVGDNGELLKTRFNDLRNLLQHIKNLTCNSPPTLTSKAQNAEPESLMAAQLYDGVLEYYLTTWKQGRVKKQTSKAVEFCLLMANGHILVEWDAATGKPYVTNEQGVPVLEGDVYIKARSSFDVAFDTNLEDDEEMDDVVVRDYVNKYETAAQYLGQPELMNKILGLQTKTETESTYHFGWDKETDQIPIYKYYRRSTTLCPQGRHAKVLSSDVVLYDGPNPYTDEMGNAIIPLLTVRANEGLGTLFGYSPANDLTPVQAAKNMMVSTGLTNYAGFGVQNVVVDRGSDIEVSALAGGMNVIEKNSGFDAPQGLSLTALPKEYFEMIQFLDKSGETYSGINSVIRGDPEASLKSGKSLNIVAGMAVQFMSGLQSSYAQLLQDLGNILLRIFKKFAGAPRLTAIVGKDKVLKSKTWNGQSLSNVAMVVAEITDPSLRTMAGRTQLAESWADKGYISSAQEYFTVYTTGQIEPIYRAETAQTNLIRQENEMMMQGVQPKVLRTDNHQLHINEHGADIASPEIRFNDAAVSVYLDHINWHERMMAGDPRPPDVFKADMAREQAQQQAMAQAAAAHGMPPPGSQPPMTKGAPVPQGERRPLPPNMQQQMQQNQRPQPMPQPGT